MACTNCTQTTASITGFVPASCMDVPACFLDAGCVFYTGPNLNCSGVNTNDGLDTILQKIDPLLCAATGDYSTYNTYCLAPITTQKQFVETISNFVCNLSSSYNTFVNITYPGDQALLDARLVSLEQPQITCVAASVTSSDSFIQILNKYCTTLTNLTNSLNPSSANWNQCYVVSPLPTTIVGGFNTLISQICILKGLVDNNIGTPPTFNNIGSCLPAPLTAADSLVDTVNKIKTRLCQTGTINTTTFSWGCVSSTVANSTDLQGTLQNILTKVTQIAQSLPTVFSNDFVVTPTDAGNACLGKTINLANVISPDRFVAATPSDNNPGTLQQKLIPGTGMSLDYITSPGFVILNNTGGVGIGDHKVAVNGTDTTPGYLVDKILSGGPVNGIQVTPSIDNINEVMLLNVSVSPSILFQALIDALSVDSTLRANFCAAVAGCPSPCDAPSNVTVTYTGGGTTSTTTTTTTT